MAQKRWALSLPLDGFTLAEHGEIAREAERLGVDVTFGERRGSEAASY